VDVGGTFTDVVVIDKKGTMRVCKVSSTPTDPSEGVLSAIDQIARDTQMEVCGLLGECTHFVHGSTIATNIVVEHRGARVGMLVTEGFRDSLEIRRGIRENAWDHRAPFPPVLVPRFLRIPVRGRIDRDGREIEPLDVQAILAALQLFRKEQVESVAICFLNSFLSNVHEITAASILKREWPDVWVTTSSAVAPIIGEYERSSTAVLNAYVAPRVIAYVERLDAELRRRGLRHAMLMVQNNGGALSSESAIQRPVSLLLSGPAAGTGALSLFAAATGHGNLLSMEIGGTSCDVTMLVKGKPELASDFELAGYHVASSTININSVGAGGGTIAGIDPGGMLFVGPNGAGAFPGPASYDQGGEEPTVTDAQLVLGRLKPGPLGESGRSLRLERAQQAIRRKVAKPLGLSVEEAAAGIVRLVEQHLLHAVERISSARGYDPRRFVLVAAGGAGPMHAYMIGRKLGSPFVYVPRLAGAFCALGMLHTSIKHEFSKVYLASLNSESDRELAPVFTKLRQDALSQLIEDGFREQETELVCELELRYSGQLGALRVPVSFENGGFDWQTTHLKFADIYSRLYGHTQRDAELEIAGARVVGIGTLPPLQLQEIAGSFAEPKPVETRQVFFEGAGNVPTRVFAGPHLFPGQRLHGPLLVEESTTTVVVDLGATLDVDSANNFVIRFDGATDEG
jgi:N-methylhydantoinase A